MRRLCLTLAGLCVVLASGCQKLSYQHSFVIEKGAPYHETEFKAAKSEQKVRATVKADATVNAYLLSADDKEDAINDLRNQRAPRNVLASGRKSTELTLEAKVPAAKPFVILIVPEDRGKEIKVELDVEGK
jgi:hypothetical protein